MFELSVFFIVGPAEVVYVVDGFCQSFRLGEHYHSEVVGLGIIEARSRNHHYVLVSYELHGELLVVAVLVG